MGTGTPRGYSRAGTPPPHTQAGSYAPPASRPGYDQAGGSDDSSGVQSMRLSNEARFVGATWQDYATTTSWTTKGGDRVYVQFRDRAGNVSPVYSAAVATVWRVYLPAITR